MSGQFGTDKCGLKIYYVTDFMDNPVPFITLKDDGTLVMAPVDGRDRVGSYTCKLHAYMEEFPNIRTAETFACDIPNCSAVINANGARGPNKLTTYWGRGVESIDIGSQLDLYTLAPACGMNLNFRTIVMDVNGTPGNYRAVNCNDIRNCYIEKCNGGPSTIGDPDCDSIPYDMYFTVIVQAYLDDGTINESISFPIEILDPCKADTLMFAPGIMNF